MGIAMSVKFHKIKQETHTPYEHAIDYIDNPWTTKYGAGIWIGLVVSLLGIVSKFCFWYQANLSELIDFYSPWNHQKTVILGAIEVNSFT